MIETNRKGTENVMDRVIFHNFKICISIKEVIWSESEKNEQKQRYGNVRWYEKDKLDLSVY